MKATWEEVMQAVKALDDAQRDLIMKSLSRCDESDVYDGYKGILDKIVEGIMNAKLAQ